MNMHTVCQNECFSRPSGRALGAGGSAAVARALLVGASLALLTACGGGAGSGSEPESLVFATKEALGESLFFDLNLSRNRTQSCATCHNPAHAFIDNRPDADGLLPAVSVGDDGISLGDRNAPTAAYAMVTPDFHFGTHARFNSQQGDYEGYIGGQFLDGREPDLKGQAAGPPLNPIEMNMPDKASVVDRLLENEDYEAAFKALFGETIFDDVDEAYAAMAESIGTFEKTDAFAPFNSKYDKSLRGEYVYSPLSKAALGKSLFFSQQFTNCATCHQLKPNGSTGETFSNYEYHNLGVPKNAAVRQLNGLDPDFVDTGLAMHPRVNDPAETGKFKVPSLRNIAVTGPYMHNGVFRELRTVIAFYDHYLVGSIHTLNPETGAPWRDPEVAENIALTELQDGRKMSEEEVEAMVCFLRTLTDERYEDLIPEEPGINCD